MNITFQKRPGQPSLGVAFFWRMEIETRFPVAITDHFIPELFFDYFFIAGGKVTCLDERQARKFPLPRGALKTIHTRLLRFVFSAPLLLYGARLTLNFAESFWEEMGANCFSKQAWIQKAPADLDAFTAQLVEYLASHRRKKFPHPLFASDLEESAWLANFSPRHKRRIYQTAFGLSRRQIQNIRNIHLFLEQSCDFAAETPRILRHVSRDVFYDQTHLNHTFKKMTGFSPVEYFQANSILQDKLMSASYNERPAN